MSIFYEEFSGQLDRMETPPYQGCSETFAITLDEDKAFQEAVSLIHLHQEVGAWGTINVRKDVGIGCPLASIATWWLGKDGKVEHIDLSTKPGQFWD